MSTHFTCAAEPEKHGAWPRAKLAHVTSGEGSRHSTALVRLACPLCRAERKDGWVRPATKDESK